MENTTTTETPVTTTETPVTSKQSILAVSPETKAFFVATSKAYPDALGKTGKPVAPSEREIGNAAVAFIEANRKGYKTEAGEDGTDTIVEVDLWDLEMRRELAMRGTITRANSAKAENAKLKEQLEALQAQLAALVGTGTPT